MWIEEGRRLIDHSMTRRAVDDYGTGVPEIARTSGLGRGEERSRCLDIDTIHARCVSHFGGKVNDGVAPFNERAEIQALEEVHLPPINVLFQATLPVVLTAHLKTQALQRGNHAASRTSRRARY